MKCKFFHIFEGDSIDMSEQISFREAVELAGIEVEGFDLDQIGEWPAVIDKGSIAKALKAAGHPAGKALIDAASMVLEFAPVQPTMVISASAAVHTDEAGEGPNPYLAQVLGDGFGMDVSHMLELNVDRMKRIASAARAYILLSLGMDEVFNKDAWQKLGMMNIPLAVCDVGYEWDKRRRQGHWVPQDDLDGMFRQFPGLFGAQWSRVMEAAAKLQSGMHVQNVLAGALNVGLSESADFAAMGTLIPAIAQSVSTNVSTGPGANIPMVAKGAVEMMDAQWAILKGRELQEAINVWKGDKAADAGAIAFLRRFGPHIAGGADIANAYQLAQIAESLILLLTHAAETRSPAQQKQFEQAFGVLALQYRTLYPLVFPETEKGGAGVTTGGFRSERAVEPAGQVVNRRWSINIDLSFGFSFRRSG
jgi:hypothetical protein